MEYNKDSNIFYEIDYNNKILFYDKEYQTDIDTTDFIKIKLSKEELKQAVCTRYKITELPCLLYYKNIIRTCQQEINKIEEKKDKLLEDEILRIINNKLVLFMKGEVNYPYCQFSKKVIQILNDNDVDLNKIIYYDVLMNEEMREMIKKVNEWPTFPQLFINGVFIGGCDILKNMNGTEVLSELVKEFKK